jgi:hypothetical protein
MRKPRYMPDSGRCASVALFFRQIIWIFPLIMASFIGTKTGRVASFESGIALINNCGQAGTLNWAKRDAMYTIHGDVNSGNCYKVKLLAEQLALPYTWVAVDILKKETHSASFLGKNPNGRIPVLETPDGKVLSESNAILHFLANGTALLPTDRFEHAQVLQWLFYEQYSHEPYIATARLYRALP